MLSSKVDVEQIAKPLIELCGEQYPWRWEEDKGILLSEFASNKKDKVFSLLTEYFEHQWHSQNIRFIPDQIKLELGDFSVLKGEQVIFTSSSDYNNTSQLVALWWPWGHGGTISLRVSVLECSYSLDDIKPQSTGLFQYIKGLFT